MRSAKDIALKILQNTVYAMVNDIRTCSQEIISGLKNRIGNLEKQQEPLEILVIELFINVQSLVVILSLFLLSKSD